MNAFMKFNKGLMLMPLQWRVWLMILVGANMLVPLFFLERLEAQLTLAVMMLSMMLMTAVTRYSGFTRLLGLGHIAWFPMLYFFWTRLDQVPVDDFFGIWLRVLMILNVMSLVIDVADVIRYIRGDRLETITSL